MPGLVVIGYDGSPDAQRAVEAARALDPEAALVVTVWQPALTAATETAIPAGGTALPYPEQDEELEAAARRTAEEGVARARAAGVAAEAAVQRGGSIGEIGRTLAALADEREATAIVVGRRGVSRLQAVVLGSVSDATVREARRPVLVVPGPDD